MAERKLVPYDPNRLPPDKADLQIDGVDSGFGEINSKDGFVRFRRVIVENGENILFDKLVIDPSPGAFVMPVRVNPKGLAEFLLVNEWKDVYGKYTPNIIQGRTQGDETPPDAAKRLVRDEAGYIPDNLVLLDRQNFDSAYLMADQPFYLATIPYDQQRSPLKRKRHEDIEELSWMRPEQVRRLGIKDGKTNLGIYLAERVLNPNLL